MVIRFLVTTETKEKGVRHYVRSMNKEHIVIGRREADVTIDDDSCSKRQAILFMDQLRRLRYLDLVQQTKARVNGEKVAVATLEVGDVIKIGKSKMKVLSFEEASHTEEAQC